MKYSRLNSRCDLLDTQPKNSWKTIRKARHGPTSPRRAWAIGFIEGMLAMAFGAWFGYWIAGAF